MTLRLRLLLDFPHNKALVLGIILSLLGISSIVVSVVGFIHRIWGYYLGTGIWSGSVIFSAGICGIIAAQIKGPCSVKAYLLTSVLASITALIVIVLSAGGMNYSSNFFKDAFLHAQQNDIANMIVYTVMLTLGITEFLLSLGSVILCAKFVCWKKSETSYPEFNSFRRTQDEPRYLRDSTSSRAPLQGRYKSPRRLNSENSDVGPTNAREFMPFPYNMEDYRDTPVENTRSNITREASSSKVSAIPQSTSSRQSYLEAVEMMPSQSGEMLSTRGDDQSQQYSFRLDEFDEDELPPYEEAIQDITLPSVSTDVNNGSHVMSLTETNDELDSTLAMPSQSTNEPSTVSNNNNIDKVTRRPGSEYARRQDRPRTIMGNDLASTYVNDPPQTNNTEHKPTDSSGICKVSERNVTASNSRFNPKVPQRHSINMAGSRSSHGRQPSNEKALRDRDNRMVERWLHDHPQGLMIPDSERKPEEQSVRVKPRSQSMRHSPAHEVNQHERHRHNSQQGTKCSASEPSSRMRTPVLAGNVAANPRNHTRASTSSAPSLHGPPKPPRLYSYSSAHGEEHDPRNNDLNRDRQNRPSQSRSIQHAPTPKDNANERRFMHRNPYEGRKNVIDSRIEDIITHHPNSDPRQKHEHPTDHKYQRPDGARHRHKDTETRTRDDVHNLDVFYDNDEFKATEKPRQDHRVNRRQNPSSSSSHSGGPLRNEKQKGSGFYKNYIKNFDEVPPSDPGVESIHQPPCERNDKHNPMYDASNPPKDQFRLKFIHDKVDDRKHHGEKLEEKSVRLRPSSTEGAVATVDIPAVTDIMLPSVPDEAKVSPSPIVKLPKRNKDSPLTSDNDSVNEKKPKPFFVGAEKLKLYPSTDTPAQVLLSPNTLKVKSEPYPLLSLKPPQNVLSLIKSDATSEKRVVQPPRLLFPMPKPFAKKEPSSFSKPYENVYAFPKQSSLQSLSKIKSKVEKPDAKAQSSTSDVPVVSTVRKTLFSDHSKNTEQMVLRLSDASVNNGEKKSTGDFNTDHDTVNLLPDCDAIPPVTQNKLLDINAHPQKNSSILDNKKLSSSIEKPKNDLSELEIQERISNDQLSEMDSGGLSSSNNDEKKEAYTQRLLPDIAMSDQINDFLRNVLRPTNHSAVANVPVMSNDNLPHNGAIAEDILPLIDQVDNIEIMQQISAAESELPPISVDVDDHDLEPINAPDPEIQPIVAALLDGQPMNVAEPDIQPIDAQQPEIQPLLPPVNQLPTQQNSSRKPLYTLIL